MIHKNLVEHICDGDEIDTRLREVVKVGYLLQEHKKIQEHLEGIDTNDC